MRLLLRKITYLDHNTSAVKSSHTISKLAILTEVQEIQVDEARLKYVHSNENKERLDQPDLQESLMGLFAVRPLVHERTIRVLTPTTPILRTLNASSPVALFLSLNPRLRPKECPSPRFLTHLLPRCTVVRFTRAVRVPVVTIVLVVLSEDGKGLAGRAGVVAAFRGLDGFACFDGYEGVNL